VSFREKIGYLVKTFDGRMTATRRQDRTMEAFQKMTEQEMAEIPESLRPLLLVLDNIGEAITDCNTILAIFKAKLDDYDRQFNSRAKNTTSPRSETAALVLLFVIAIMAILMSASAMAVVQRLKNDIKESRVVGNDGNAIIAQTTAAKIAHHAILFAVRASARDCSEVSFAFCALSRDRHAISFASVAAFRERFAMLFALRAMTPDSSLAFRTVSTSSCMATTTALTFSGRFASANCFLSSVNSGEERISSSCSRQSAAAFLIVLIRSAIRPSNLRIGSFGKDIAVLSATHPQNFNQSA